MPDPLETHRRERCRMRSDFDESDGKRAALLPAVCRSESGRGLRNTDVYTDAGTVNHRRRSIVRRAVDHHRGRTIVVAGTPVVTSTIAVFIPVLVPVLVP